MSIIDNFILNVSCHVINLRVESRIKNLNLYIQPIKNILNFFIITFKYYERIKILLCRQ